MFTGGQIMSTFYEIAMEIMLKQCLILNYCGISNTELVYENEPLVRPEIIV